VVSLCLSARDLVVVATPDTTAMTDAYALIKVLSRAGLWWSPFICVNRARGRQQGRLVFEKLRATAGKHLGLNCRYLGCVLEDEAVGLAASLRRPVAEAAPRSGAARDLAALARALDEAETPGRRRDVSPLRFLDGSIMRLKQERGALAGIARTASACAARWTARPPDPQGPTRRTANGCSKAWPAWAGGRPPGTPGRSERLRRGRPGRPGRLAAAMRAELAIMRALLTPGAAPGAARKLPAGPGAGAPATPAAAAAWSAPQPRNPREYLRPGACSARKPCPACVRPWPPWPRPPRPAPRRRTHRRRTPPPRRLPPAAPRAGPAGLPALAHARRAGRGAQRGRLRPEAVHPRALNGGDHFAGYSLGLVCWTLRARDLERVVARRAPRRWSCCAASAAPRTRSRTSPACP
jgi:flagellar biosynthesis protein FlhG